MSARRDLPALFGALPPWHPGAWGPPAETISWASLAVFALTAYRLLLRDEYVKALFKFQCSTLWISLPVALVAWVIVWAGSMRPGGKWPRYWALALAVFCSALVVWGLFAQMSTGTANAIALSDDPRLHALSAVGLMAVLALVPRLLRAHPYSRRLFYAAPFALAVVSILCLVSASWAENRVIKLEEARLQEKIDRTEQNCTKIADILHPTKIAEGTFFDPVPQGPKLSDVELGGKSELPSKFDWERLHLLHRQEDMHRALSSCLANIEEGILNPRLQPVSGRPMHLVNGAWMVNQRFTDEAAKAAVYYRELGRLHQELRDTYLASPFASEYWTDQQILETRLRDHASRFSQQWVPALIVPDSRSTQLDSLLKSHVGSLGFALGDFNEWKHLPWQSAKSTIGNDGCDQTINKLWQEEIDDPTVTSSGGSAEPSTVGSSSVSLEHKITINRYSARIECYAYRPTHELNGIEMLAELDLSYEFKNTSLMSRNVTLLFYIPPETEPARYHEEIRTALASSGSRLEPGTAISHAGRAAFEVKLSSP